MKTTNSTKQNNTIPLMSINDLAMSAALDNAKSERPSKNLQLSLEYGTTGAKLSKQLKAQGHKFDKEFIKECQEIRITILALSEIGILIEKEVRSAFERLNESIAYCIAHETYGESVKSIELVK